MFGCVCYRETESMTRQGVNDPAGFISCDVCCAAEAVTHSHPPYRQPCSSPQHHHTTSPLSGDHRLIREAPPNGKRQVNGYAAVRSVTQGRVRLSVKTRKIHRQIIYGQNWASLTLQSGGYSSDLLNENFKQNVCSRKVTIKPNAFNIKTVSFIRILKHFEIQFKTA